MPIDYSKCPTKDELSFVKGAIGNIQQQIDDLSGGGGGVTTGNLTESTSSVLNIVGGTNAVVGSGTSIQVKQASATLNGYLSSTDWNTFNSKEPALAKGNLTESVSSVLTISGGTNAVIGSGTSIQVKQASGSQGGFLASTDFNTFNNKQDALSSGVNIKTINSNSLVGSGNVAVQDVLVSGTNIKTINTNSLLGAGNISVQDTLVSGTNIKTINSSSLLGSGDVSVQPTLVSGTNIKTINSGSILGSGDLLLQDKLVSGTNIKTINSTSLLGSGDLPVQATLVSGTNIKTINSTSLLGSGDVVVQPTLVSGTNIKTINGNSLLGSGDVGAGYTLSVQALTSSPTDAQTIYFGNLPKAPVTTAGTSKVYIRKAGTIKVAEIYCYSGTAGTNESWSMYIRKNNLTDTLIATLGVNTNERVFSNTALSIAVAVGDYIEIKCINPTWATNPLTTIFGGYIYIE